ncbi:MAG TPA: dCMP deaminase [Streptosporangiaceae bacterium]|jgi:diaminohydroxyphosphoribosylaminopyrimidine deaminase/5-amino-6-(5-phosphoribosylamino)uracil reductase
MTGTAQATADHGFLREAVELSRRCPPSDSAFSVGAILVGPDGAVIATGYSRELNPRDHAEEVALAKAGALPGSDRPGPGEQAGAGATGPAGTGVTAGAADGGGVLGGATMYTSLEPCRRRLSRTRSCAELIVAAGIGRVVLAWREPPLFVPGGGADWLREQGVTVQEMPALAGAARAVNAHLLPR